MAVISFYDPKSKCTPKDYAPVDYTNVYSRVFPIAIHDIDIQILPDYGFAFETDCPESDELARGIVNCISEGYDIVFPLWIWHT